MSSELCEICGRRPAKVIVIVENAKMLACSVCGRSGRVIGVLEHEGRRKAAVGEGATTRSSLTSSAPEEEIVEDYAQRIKKAREKLKLPIAVVAEKINEKLSYLEHIERGKTMPTFKTARKLEKELGVKLIEKREPELVGAEEVKNVGRKEITLADLLQHSSSRTKKDKDK